jgi:hypothetical protein
MENTIQEIKKYVSPMDNIETKMYINMAGKYCVRLYDLDALEVVIIYVCKNQEQAEFYFEKVKNK